MFTNSRIEEDVRPALGRDPRIKHPELIAMSVNEIGTVVLRGAVGTLPERLAAAHGVRDVEGVFEVVVGDLKVHPPIEPRRTDDEIRTAALQRLIWDARIRSTHIHVKVSHGHLTLTGYVREQVASAAAAEDVASLNGVVGVTNRIEIRWEGSMAAAATSPRPLGRGSLWRRHRRAITAALAVLVAAGFAHTSFRTSWVSVRRSDGCGTVRSHGSPSALHWRRVRFLER